MRNISPAEHRRYATAGAACAILERHVTPIAEAKLAFAVIEQAAFDKINKSTTGEDRRDASAFFTDGRLEIFAYRAGLDSSYTRDILQRGGIC